MSEPIYLQICTAIRDAVCEALGVDPDDLRENARHGRLQDVRAITARFLRDQYKLDFDTIGDCIRCSRSGASCAYRRSFMEEPSSWYRRLTPDITMAAHRVTQRASADAAAHTN